MYGELSKVRLERIGKLAPSYKITKLAKVLRGEHFDEEEEVIKTRPVEKAYRMRRGGR